MNRSRLLITLSLASIAALSAAAGGPTGTLYIMNYGEFGSATGIDRIQGMTYNATASSNNLDICIAAYGDVRTMGYSQNDKGSKFDLSGSPLVGGPYVNTIANSQLHDGTSDGSFNYSVNYTTGDVLEFDRNWASPLTLFNVSTSLPGAGFITMNSLDGSFWISQWGGPDTVQHYTHGGILLSTWNSGVNTSTGLALDPLDGTLWMGDLSTPWTLHQFSQGGTLLQSVSYTFANPQGSWYGMEFDTTPVPEPATIAALGMALLATMRRRRTGPLTQKI